MPCVAIGSCYLPRTLEWNETRSGLPQVTLAAIFSHCKPPRRYAFSTHRPGLHTSPSHRPTATSCALSYDDKSAPGGRAVAFTLHARLI